MKYVHTNIVAKDWRKLAQFYIDVFECEPILPEKNIRGEWFEKISNIKDVELEGIHLQLPGYSKNGPTLEIFQYNQQIRIEKKLNQSGFAHIAFSTSELKKTLKIALAHGAQQVGEVVEKSFEKLGKITAVYLKDPEGNIIELQHWE
ncbi:MAG: glyoxalase [Bacteroidetes bacterium]|nr:glyoxalase [Bacteroidota bacterium]|tara:strand:- start:9 stop:449 length:441 start_codon:yes stop_codon:yes gene_type:complete